MSPIDRPEGEAAPETVADLLAARADDDHPAVLFEGHQWSWRELVAEAGQRAALLEPLRGSGPFHVGVMLENVPEYLFTLAGAALCGAVVVGINTTRRGADLARDIRHTDCCAIVTDRSHLPLLDGLDTGVGREATFVVDDPDRDTRTTERTAGAGGGAGASAVAAGNLYLLLFTSGSSGAPKAVRMTHARAVRASESPICSREDTAYCAMPLFHGNALNAIVLPAMRRGATIALKRRFSASEFIDDVRDLGCTYTSTIGRVLTYILATPERPDDGDNPLHLVLGPESSAADMERFRQRFGAPVFSGYGSSENAIVLLPPPPNAPGALGVAPVGEDIAVVDSTTGVECPPARIDDAGVLLNAQDAIGELVNRSPADRFEGYWNNDEAEEQRRRGGWYWSADLAYRDEGGVFWFAGRTADWIRVDGENFATAPIERVLARFEGVSGVCVYGVPDERNAEDQVMATLEMHEHAPFDPGAFAEFLGGQSDLGTKWVPRFVRVVEKIPVTGNDKVARAPLRSSRWNCDDPIWWKSDRRQSGYAPLTGAEKSALNESLATNRGPLDPGGP